MTAACCALDLCPSSLQSQLNTLCPTLPLPRSPSLAPSLLLFTLLLLLLSLPLHHHQLPIPTLSIPGLSGALHATLCSMTLSNTSSTTSPSSTSSLFLTLCFWLLFPVAYMTIQSSNCFCPPSCATPPQPPPHPTPPHQTNACLPVALQ